MECVHNIKRMLINKNMLNYVSRRYCNSQYKEIPSAIYIGNSYKDVSLNFPIKANIDFEELESGEEKIIDMLDKRKINIKFNNFKDSCQKYGTLSRKVKMIKEDLNYTDQKKKLLDSKSNEFYSIVRVIMCLRKDLKLVYQEKLDMDEFILQMLKLPALLHPTVPLEDEETTIGHYRPFDFNAKNFTEIAIDKNELQLTDVSPNGVFLVGRLSLLELALEEYFIDVFEAHKFMLTSTLDMVKASLLEGCGGDQFNLSNVYQINDKGVMISAANLYLTGSPSIYNLCSAFTKVIVKPDNVKIATSGYIYKPTECKLPYFNNVQSKCVAGLWAYKSGKDETVKKEILTMVRLAFSELGLHFKINFISGPKLLHYETMAYNIAMFSTTTNDYMEVGRISFCGNFVSHRIQFVNDTYGPYGHFVYIQLANVNTLIGLIVENTQTKCGDYKIPQCLDKGMLIDCNYVK